MNLLFPLLILSSVLWVSVREVLGGAALGGLTQSLTAAATEAVQLGLTLAGLMAVFLGLLRVVEAADLMAALARPLRPLLLWLFPKVPPDDPALTSVALNLSANFLGLGNAATPFGLRAMEQLERANPMKGVASDAQIMFLALNTAGITLLPTKVIALRASLGSVDPALVTGPTLAASLCAAIAGIAAARVLDRDRPAVWLGFFQAMMPLVAIALLAGVMVAWGSLIGPWLLPMMIAGFLGAGWAKGVRVYEAFVEGARDGLSLSLRILPYVLAILVAVGMARASGALDAALAPIARLLAPTGLAPEALVMAVTRSLSGSGSFGLLASYLGQSASGPDTALGLLLSTIYGSTETTFYVIAIYFGAAGIRDLRHAVAIGLIADAAGLGAATVICRLMTG